ncbi:MAG TPA: cyclase family protein, partial [Gemmatimonadaceae bacterium]
MSDETRRIWDVSMPVRNGGLVYPGNPPITTSLMQSIAKGDTANVSRLDFGSHTATHVDAPLHFMAGGAGVDQLPLDVLIGRARLIAFPDDVM